MARMVATKAALSIRVDALTDADGKSEEQAPSIGLANRAKLESRLRALEHQNDMSGVRRYADDGKKQQKFSMTGDVKTYNTAADAVDLVPTQREPLETAIQAVLDVKTEKKKAKEERKAKRKSEKEKEKESDSDVADKMDVDEESKDSKKEKKRKRRESEANGQADAGEAKVGLRLSSTCVCIVDCTCRRMARLKPSGRQRRRHARPKRQQPQLLTERLQRRKRRRPTLSGPLGVIYPLTWFCRLV
jgi:hypothetical protein